MMPRYTKASLNFCRHGSNRNQITQARKALSSPHTGIDSLKLYYIRLFLTQLTGGFIIFAVCGCSAKIPVCFSNSQAHQKALLLLPAD